MSAEYFEAKRDEGKLKWRLLPWSALSWVVKVLVFGARKYNKDSWKAVPDALERYREAAFRHAIAYEMGEIFDEESGLPHTAHLACNALFMIFLEEQEGLYINPQRYDIRRGSSFVSSVVDVKKADQCGAV